MIEHKLLYYPTKQQFLTDQEEKGIAPTSIAFIEDSDTIYTHGHEFVCGGGNGGVIQADLDQIKMEIGDDTDSKLQILMDRVNSTISLLATKNFVQSAIDSYGQGLNIQNRVEQILNAKDPSWSVLVSRLASLEGSNQNLNEQIARIEAQIQHEDGEYPTITLETIYRLFNEGEDNQTFRDIVAKIFMMANEEGSSITLDADKIYLGNETNQLKLYIRGAIQDALRVNDSSNALTYAQLLATGIKFETADGDKLYLTQNDGLKYTAGRTNPDHAGEVGYQLANDGSGSLAFGNITWDSSGNLTTHGLMLKEAEAMGAANSLIIDSVFIYPEEYNGAWMDIATIKYHICKSGFIVKYGEAKMDGPAFLYGATAEYAGVPLEYHSHADYGGTWYAAGNATIYSVYAYSYGITFVTAAGIIKRLYTDTRNVWQNMLKYPNDENLPQELRNTWIFNEGDSVYVQFPSEIYTGSVPSTSINVARIPGEYGQSANNADAEAIAQALCEEIKTSLNSSQHGHSWAPNWSYRFKGEYDSSATYTCNNQYKDVVMVTDTETYSSPTYYYYLCVRDNTSDVDPQTDQTNEYWTDATSIDYHLGIFSTVGQTYKPTITVSNMSFDSKKIIFKGDQLITWSNNPS